MTAVRAQVLADLRERISSIEGEGAKKAGCLPFGVAEIDAFSQVVVWRTELSMNLRAVAQALSMERPQHCSPQGSPLGRRGRSYGV